MRNVVFLILICALTASISACNGKPAEQAAQKQQSPQTAKAYEGGDAGRAAAFLAGVQKGDVAAMYQAANLTVESVNDSREKLVHIKQHKLTDAQRVAYEHVLRISGDVELFKAKLRQLFPASAKVKVVEAAAKKTPGTNKHLVHTVVVTYGSRAEAILDKKGKPVQEMKLRLQQFDYSFGTGEVHEFSFESSDFDKIADRDFDVVSYF